MKTLTSLALLLVVAIVGFVAQVAVRKGLNPQKPSVEQTLVHVAKEINKKAPTKVDANTSLLNAAAFGTTLRYHYRLSNVSAKNFVRGSIGKVDGERMKMNVCSTEAMQPLVELRAILEYAYYDKDGVELEVVPIDTSKCR